MKPRALGVSPLARTLRKEKRYKYKGGSFGGGFMPTEPKEQKPIRQRNTRTGQERISYDGGKTWSIL